MALALAAADSDGIYLATDSGGAQYEKYGPQSGLVRSLGARYALALGHAVPLDIMNGQAALEAETIYDAARVVREHLSKTCCLSGNHVPALVCGFDDDGSPRCYAIEHDQPLLEPKSASTSGLSFPAVHAVGAFSTEASQRAFEAYSVHLSIPRALRCGVNRAFALEEAQTIFPWERNLHLPVMVFHLRIGGEMSRIL